MFPVLGERKRFNPDLEPREAMGVMSPTRYLLLSLLLSTLVTSGCSSLILGTVMTGDNATAEERSVSDAVNDLSIRAELNRIF